MCNILLLTIYTPAQVNSEKIDLLKLEWSWFINLFNVLSPLHIAWLTLFFIKIFYISVHSTSHPKSDRRFHRSDPSWSSPCAHPIYIGIYLPHSQTEWQSPYAMGKVGNEFHHTYKSLPMLCHHHNSIAYRRRSQLPQRYIYQHNTNSSSSNAHVKKVKLICATEWKRCQINLMKIGTFNKFRNIPAPHHYIIV